MYTIIMHIYAIEFYETERGDNFVAEFLDGLTKKTRNKTLAWIAMLKKYGPDLKRPYSDLLDSCVFRSNRPLFRFNSATIPLNSAMSKT